MEMDRGLASFCSRRSARTRRASTSAFAIASSAVVRELNRRVLLLKELKSGTRIVAHRYGFGDARPPEKTVQAGAGTIYFWTVPKR